MAKSFEEVRALLERLKLCHWEAVGCKKFDDAIELVVEVRTAIKELCEENEFHKKVIHHHEVMAKFQTRQRDKYLRVLAHIAKTNPDVYDETIKQLGCKV